MTVVVYFKLMEESSNTYLYLIIHSNVTKTAIHYICDKLIIVYSNNLLLMFVTHTNLVFCVYFVITIL